MILDAFSGEVNVNIYQRHNHDHVEDAPEAVHEARMPLQRGQVQQVVQREEQVVKGLENDIVQKIFFQLPKMLT